MVLDKLFREIDFSSLPFLIANVSEFNVGGFFAPSMRRGESGSMKF
jgi:hypothetical protein